MTYDGPVLLVLQLLFFSRLNEGLSTDGMHSQTKYPELRVYREVIPSDQAVQASRYSR